MYLRQATSGTVLIGPYVSSDGAALTALTLTQSTFMLSANGGAFAAKNETTSGSHRALGYYSAMLNDTDTAAAGRLLIASSAAAALPVWKDYVVLPGSVYDYLIGGTAPLYTGLNLPGIGAVWGVSMSSVSPVAARSPLNALRVLRNRVSTSGSILTVYGEDDATAVYTATLTLNSSADPIVEIDPAG